MPFFAFALFLAAELPPAASSIPNLDFRSAFTGWENDGFTLLPAAGDGSTAVCSSDRDRPGRTALLHRALVIPSGSGMLRCTAHAVRAPSQSANDKLDVVLIGAGK